MRGEDGQQTVYMAMSLHNAGSGVAVIHGWRFYPERPGGVEQTHPPPETFRRQTRDLYIPVNDTGFWQAAYREPDDPEYPADVAAIKARTPVGVDLLYGDHEGGQRVISRFSVMARRCVLAAVGGPALEHRPVRPEVTGRPGLAGPARGNRSA